MRRIGHAPTNVRVVAIALAVVAHLLALLLFVIERRMQRSEVEQQARLVVSLWPFPEPPSPPPRPPVARPTRNVRALAPVVTTEEPPARAPAAVEPEAPDPVVAPPVDWSRAALDAAKLYMQNHAQPDVLSSVPDPNVPRKPCRPPEISEAMQAKIDKLLDRPVDAGPPITSPPGSVMMGGQRVGVIVFGGPIGRKSVKVIPPEELLAERKSSVPDPHTCD